MPERVWGFHFQPRAGAGGRDARLAETGKPLAITRVVANEVPLVVVHNRDQEGEVWCDTNKSVSKGQFVYQTTFQGENADVE